MKNKITTKIIAGEFKGRILELPSLDVTRSSKSMLKESYFNTLQFDIVDAIFVELFGGSGSIGLEALSRGAREVHFFEKDAHSFKVLRSNIEKLNASKCFANQGDVFVLAPSLLQQLKSRGEKAFFYVDPPFSIRDNMSDIYDRTLHFLETIPSEIVEMLTIEHMSDLKLPETIGTLKHAKTKKFGITSLSYYK